MLNKRVLNALIKCREECHQRMKDIEKDRVSLREEELALGEKLEQLNRTISLFAYDEDTPKKRKGRKRGPKGIRFKNTDPLDIPIEMFASVRNPSQAAKICQDVRSILGSQKGYLTLDDIIPLLAAKHSYAKGIAFKSTLSRVMKAAREAGGKNWLVYSKEGQKNLYKHI